MGRSVDFPFAIRVRYCFMSHCISGYFTWTCWIFCSELQANLTDPPPRIGGLSTILFLSECTKSTYGLSGRDYCEITSSSSISISSSPQDTRPSWSRVDVLYNFCGATWWFGGESTMIPLRIEPMPRCVCLLKPRPIRLAHSVHTIERFIWRHNFDMWHLFNCLADISEGFTIDIISIHIKIKLNN
jgi:hypothetical protein